MKSAMPENTPDQNLTIVIPVYNEAQSLSVFLPDLIKACEANNWRLIFVNDGSQDKSAQILSEIGQKDFVQVFHHKLNRGYGGALKTGIANVVTPYTITMDGDGQHRLEDVEAIYLFSTKNDADMVIGTRTRTKKSNLYREIGKWLIRTFTRLLVPLPIKDLNSGFKLFDTGLVQQYISLCPDSMAFSDVITLLFLNQRHLVLEYPIEVHSRVAGESTISTRTAFETIVEILGLLMLVNPLRIFLPLSFISVLVGVAWGIPIVWMGRGVSVGAMLAIVVGVFFFILGLIAGQLSAIRMHLSKLKKNKN